MYAKIFSQIYDSSIAEDYLTRLVFMDFIVLANSDGVIDMTRDALARRTNVPLKIINRAIERLESPDPQSRSENEVGRRIVRLDEHRDWGWQIVNFRHFDRLRTEQERREYQRDLMRRRRAATRDKNTVSVADTESVSTVLAPVSNSEQSLAMLAPASASASASATTSATREEEGESIPSFGTNTSENFLVSEYQRLHGVTRSQPTVLAKIQSALSYRVRADAIETAMNDLHQRGIKAEIWDVLDPLVRTMKDPDRKETPAEKEFRKQKMIEAMKDARQRAESEGL